MAVKKISVLECDACGEQQASAEVLDELGIEISAWFYAHGAGGYGGKKTYFCLDCTNGWTLAELLSSLYQRLYGNPTEEV